MMRAIEDGPSCHNHTPFVLANEDLARILGAEKYKPDTVLGGQCGLSVSALRFDPSREENASILNRVYPSPGRDAIWPHDDERVPEEKLPVLRGTAGG